MSIIAMSLVGSITPLCRKRQSRTTLIPRGFTTDATLEHALSSYRLFHNSYDDKPYDTPRRPIFTMQTTYFYEESNNRHSIEQYFFPHGANQLCINQNGQGHIGSEWVGLAAPEGKEFRAIVNLEPTRRAYGALTKFHLDLGCFIENLWISAFVSALYVEHDLDFFGRMRSAEGVCPTPRPSHAFNNDTWRYGRLPTEKKEINGYDDINLKLGYTLTQGEFHHVELYGNTIIPMGSRPTARMLFEPIIGNGGHWGLGVGMNGEVHVWDKGKHRLSFLVDIVYRYLFSATERRLFDLCNSEWSRYFKVAHRSSPSIGCFGINYFARDVEVHPRDVFESWSALHYRHSDFNAELGINVWWRNSEKLCLVCPFPEDIGIFDLANQSTSASNARICQASQGCNTAPSDETFTPIRTSHINIESARQRSASSIKLSLALGFHGRFLGKPSLFGFGGAYEIPRDNAGLEQWVFWFKSNITF